MGGIRPILLGVALLASAAGPARAAAVPASAAAVPEVVSRCAGYEPAEMLCMKGLAARAALLRDAVPRAPASALETGCALPGADDRCERWSAVLDDPDAHGEPANGINAGTGVAVGPAGSRAYLMSTTLAPDGTHFDVAVESRDAASGARGWRTVFHGIDETGADAFAIQVSPDGARVYVVGYTAVEGRPDVDLVAVALDAASGAQVWATSLPGPAGDDDAAFAAALSPDGATLYAAGITHDAATEDDGILVALDALTGTVDWSHVVDGGASTFDLFLSVKASGSGVYATGLTVREGAPDFLTVAFDAAGAERWRDRFGTPGGNDQSGALALSPDGATAFVSGYTFQTSGRATTIAYDTATGAKRWTTQGPIASVSLSIAVAEDGSRVYVAGQAAGTVPPVYGYYTAAYDAASGAVVWSKVFEPTGTSYSVAFSVVSTGGRVVAAGDSFLGYFVMKGDIAAVAYDEVTGNQVWAARNTVMGGDTATELPLPAYAAAGGGRAFVVGTYLNTVNTSGESNLFDGWTVAYDA